MVMKNAKTKGNGTGKPKSKKQDKPKKLTAEQLSDADRQRLLLQHKRRLKPLIIAENAAKDAVRKQYELAKKEGVTRKALEIAFLLDTEEGTEKVKGRLQQILDVDRWMGKELGEQLDMFPKQAKAEKLFEDGKRAALDDQIAQPPSSLSQKDGQIWLEGHAAGRAILNESRFSGFKPLGETVKDIVPPAPIGDQEPTHEERKAA